MSNNQSTYFKPSMDFNGSKKFNFNSSSNFIENSMTLLASTPKLSIGNKKAMKPKQPHADTPCISYIYQYIYIIGLV